MLGCRGSRLNVTQSDVDPDESKATTDANDVDADPDPSCPEVSVGPQGTGLGMSSQMYVKGANS